MSEVESTAAPKEIGTKLDWTELYWSGFTPASIGATPLLTTTSDDTGVKRALFNLLRGMKELISNDPYFSDHKSHLKFIDYFVTLKEEKKPSEDGSPSSSELVIRLWHKHCFAGARESGTANPAQLNIIGRFSTEGEVISIQPWSSKTPSLSD